MPHSSVSITDQMWMVFQTVFGVNNPGSHIRNHVLRPYLATGATPIPDYDGCLAIHEAMRRPARFGVPAHTLDIPNDIREGLEAASPGEHYADHVRRVLWRLIHDAETVLDATARLGDRYQQARFVVGEPEVIDLDTAAADTETIAVDPDEDQGKIIVLRIPTKCSACSVRLPVGTEGWIRTVDDDGRKKVYCVTHVPAGLLEQIRRPTRVRPA